MQVLDIDQIRGWDKFTIIHEPVSSLQLMERAASACFQWLTNNGYKGKQFTIFCGNGNNGGDGLSLARLLSEKGHSVSVFIAEGKGVGTEDFQLNLISLQTAPSSIKFISGETSIPVIPADTIIIDALFGSGLNKPLEGISKLLADYINTSGNEIISLDIPSGLFADRSSLGNTIVHATHTLSFQCYKLAFLMAENESYVGQLHILDIGLHADYLQTIIPQGLLIDESLIRSLFKKRKLFAHKGHFGHAALLAGSYGMMGAAVLAAKSCLRSGVGKLTCHIPACGYTVMQTSIPEAMCVVEGNEEFISSFTSPEKYDAVGIGPGLGLHASNSSLLSQCFLGDLKPLVLDADALNSISEDPALLQKIPANTIITPHVKEFERLFGKAANDFERMQIAIQKTNALRIVIVLKGRYSLVATPGGNCYFNTTGNPGMAKGGQGDVLTGMILSFLAQGYASPDAACISVYLHGYAADLAIAGMAMEALMPSDVIEFIGEAIKKKLY